MTIDIPVKILKHGKIFPKPIYQTDGSSGIDLYAAIKRNISLSRLARQAIPTGLCFEIPSGYEGHIRPRSGMFLNYGVMPLFGTIDSDFRGEVKILLINLSEKSFEITPGMRIGQIIFNKYEKVNLIESKSLKMTIRGDKGFGSTGK